MDPLGHLATISWSDADYRFVPFCSRCTQNQDRPNDTEQGDDGKAGGNPSADHASDVESWYRHWNL
jgi:hypothetical protein